MALDSENIITVKDFTADPLTFLNRAAHGARIAILEDGAAVAALVGIEDFRYVDADAADTLATRMAWRTAVAKFTHYALAQQVVEAKASTKPVRDIARILAMSDAGATASDIGNELNVQPRTVKGILDRARRIAAQD